VLLERIELVVLLVVLLVLLLLLVLDVVELVVGRIVLEVVDSGPTVTTMGWRLQWAAVTATSPVSAAMRPTYAMSGSRRRRRSAATFARSSARPASVSADSPFSRSGYQA
jgi:hypothetical protein